MRGMMMWRMGDKETRRRETNNKEINRKKCGKNITNNGQKIALIGENVPILY
jgi:hypothetical protein